jgi:benzylsuccinate CoA-transferase BbsE subunit
LEELLSPYRVLDLADEKGMLCGRLLADMGADVIKVEPPGGDPARRFGPFYKDILDPEKSLFWFFYNANKRGVTLNLETEDGREVFREFIKGVDILIESFDPGRMESLGLGYEDLSKLNPRLIMTRITPFGQKGPKANYKTSELTRWASTGVMYCTGDPDRPPVGVTLPQARLHAGLEAAFTSLAALYYQGITGEGQEIDVSMQMSAIDATLDTPERWVINQTDFKRSGFEDSYSDKGIMQKMGLPCRDGYVAIYLRGGGLLASAEHLGRLREWMREEGNAPDWFMELDFVKDYETGVLTQELVDRVENTIESFVKTKTKEELFQRAVKDKLIIAPVQAPDDMWDDAQLRARDFWVWLEHKEISDRLPYAGAFALCSQTPLKLKRPAPGIGEHNEEIYFGELSIPKDRLVLLEENGII